MSIRELNLTALVKYQVATYKGEIEVMCSEGDDKDFILAKAKSIVARQSGGHLPFGYEHWWIDSIREDCE